MDSLIQLKKSAPLFVNALLLTCFALSPRVQAVVPPPDGGYPNANTAEGTDALFSLTIGSNNTAIGFNALYLITRGDREGKTGKNIRKREVAVAKLLTHIHDVIGTTMPTIKSIVIGAISTPIMIRQCSRRKEHSIPSLMLDIRTVLKD
jgi:hypothetical protein